VRLLLVEDDSALQQILRWELEELGYRVTTASSCQEARALISHHNFDCALLDYHLADGPSTELIAEFRANNSSAPVVLCSGEASAETIAGISTERRVPFLTKPVSVNTVHRLLQSLRRQAFNAEADR